MTQKTLDTFYPLEIINEQGKLIYDDRNQSRGCPLSGGGKRELSGGNGNARYLACSGGSMGVGTCQNSSNCTLKICALQYL